MENSENFDFWRKKILVKKIIVWPTVADVTSTKLFFDTF